MNWKWIIIQYTALYTSLTCLLPLLVKTSASPSLIHLNIWLNLVQTYQYRDCLMQVANAISVQVASGTENIIISRLDKTPLCRAICLWANRDLIQVSESMCLEGWQFLKLYYGGPGSVCRGHLWFKVWPLSTNIIAAAAKRMS